MPWRVIEPEDIQEPTAEDVVAVVDNKDGYRADVFEQLFKAVKRINNAELNRQVKLEIGIGMITDMPYAKLDEIVQSIQVAALHELKKKGVIADCSLENRDIEGEPFQEQVAYITCVPKKVIDWYGTEELGASAMGNIMAHHRELARALNSVTAALYYLQIFEWYENEEKDLDGYISKRREDLEAATSLTISEQKTARAILEEDKWLDVQLPKHDIRVDRFKPLKPITMDRKSADALREASRKRSEKMSRFDQLWMELEAIQDAIEDNPTHVLQKYENKSTGELPPITGDKKSTFSRLGDDIWDRKGFERYNHDEQAMLRDYAAFKDLLKKEKARDREIKELREELQKKNVERGS